MHNLDNVAAFKTSIRLFTIHCLHDFPHKQDSQLNSLVLITVVCGVLLLGKVYIL